MAFCESRARKKLLRVAVVGLGMGRSHIRCCRASDVAEFARLALAGRTHAEGDWRDGLAVQRMLEGIYRSARLGRKVRI